MNHLHDPRLLLPWILLIVAELFLCGTLLRARAAAAEHKAFRALAFFSLVRSCSLILLAEFGPYAIYWWAYWLSDFVLLALQATVLGELCLRLFRPLWAQRWREMQMFVEVFVLLLLGLFLTAFLEPHESSPFPELMQSVAWTAERTLTFCGTAAIGFMLLFASYCHCRWQDHLFGIALGMGVEVGANCILATLAAASPSHLSAALLGAMPFSSSLAFFLWGFYFLRPDHSDPVWDAPPTTIPPLPHFDVLPENAAEQRASAAGQARRG